MALNHTTLPIQLAQELRITQKILAFFKNNYLSDNANYNRRLYVATNAYSTSVNEEGQALATNLAHLDSVQVPGIRSLWNSYIANMYNEKGFFGVLKNDLTLLTDADIAAGAIDYIYTDTAGVIAISERRGYWGALRREMDLDDYYVTANGITLGSLTAAASNIGSLTKTSATGESHCLAGSIVIEVVDDTVQAPKLRVTNKLTFPWMADGSSTVVGDNFLQPEKSWEDGPTGITMVLTRGGLAAPTEAGDNGNLFASSSISSPHEGDSNKGKIFIKVSRQSASPIWLIQWYKDSALTQLAQSTTADTTAGTVALDMTAANGMRFQTTFSRANANTLLVSAGDSDSDITFDIASPRIGDRWTMTSANDEAGLYSTKLANIAHVSLMTAGSNLYTDSNASSISMS